MFFLNELQLRWGCNIVVSLKSHRFLGAFPHLPPQQTLALADTFRTCSSRCKRLVARSEFKVRPGESICAYWTRWAEWCGSSLIAHNRSAAACLQHFNAFHAIFSNPWKSKHKPGAQSRRCDQAIRQPAIQELLSSNAESIVNLKSNCSQHVAGPGGKLRFHVFFLMYSQWKSAHVKNP